MILQDRKEREKGIAKNAVEAYVYDMRGKLFSQLEKFITEEVIIELGYKQRSTITNICCLCLFSFKKMC